MLSKNREITVNITIMTLALLLVFLYIVKMEFRHLKTLTNSVLMYDPEKNNFPMKILKETDEISLMQNAIVSMVTKINLYTKLLDSHKALLEDKVKQRTEELERSNQELKELASVDPLTKLYNRRYFTESSEKTLDLAKRNNKAMSIIMLDIDMFKDINDTYGHATGDKCIVAVSNVLLELTRKSDVVCRFGGEEFIVLLPETNMDGAYTIAEKIRNEIQLQKMKVSANKEVRLTVSAGVSEVNLEKDANIEIAIHRADYAMYEAKRAGRNNTFTFNS